jgi:hypothetical protein
MTPDIFGRRAELLAEIFLQDLQPAFVARLELREIPFDFLAGFKSTDGFLTIVAIEVKAVSRLDDSRFWFHASKDQLTFLRASNLPVLLLFVDTKQNRIFYTWGETLAAPPSDVKMRRGFPRSLLTPTDGAGRQRLLAQLTRLREP